MTEPRCPYCGSDAVVDCLTERGAPGCDHHCPRCNTYFTASLPNPENASPRCPDWGTCHHLCTTTCFRVQCCEPLSGVYPGNQWPRAVVEHPSPLPNPENASQ
jgi:hypothetical protein